MGQYIEQLEEENDRLVERVSHYVEKRETQLDTRLRVFEQTVKGTGSQAKKTDRYPTSICKN